jgi:hypothetical protein
MALTRTEFHQRFRGRMLLALTEAFAARKCGRDETAAIIDEHALHMKQLRDDIYDALIGKDDVVIHAEKKPSTNGHHPRIPNGI